MLQVNIPARELFDDVKQEFLTTKSCELQLEHSLISLSKWESKWCKPFLSKNEKTYEETIDYIRCMTINKGVPIDIYSHISNDVFNKISLYIDNPMTATWFNEQTNSKANRDVITAEIVYYWMICYQIPMECQKWHLNRLLTLIKVCNIKNQPPKKMGKAAMLSQRRAVNQSRRNGINSKG